MKVTSRPEERGHLDFGSGSVIPAPRPATPWISLKSLGEKSQNAGPNYRDAAPGAPIGYVGNSWSLPFSDKKMIIMLAFVGYHVVQTGCHKGTIPQEHHH